MHNKVIIILILLTGIFSCKKEECTIPPNEIKIRLVDQNHVDLLNPNNPSSYVPSEIRVYYEEGNGIKNVPFSVVTNYQQTFYALSAELGWYADGGKTFYLELSANDTDTLYSKFIKHTRHCIYYEEKEFQYNGLRQYPGFSAPGGFSLIYQVKKN